MGVIKEELCCLFAAPTVQVAEYSWVVLAVQTPLLLLSGLTSASRLASGLSAISCDNSLKDSFASLMQHAGATGV